jgi:hypothetical protein
LAGLGTWRLLNQARLALKQTPTNLAVIALRDATNHHPLRADMPNDHYVSKFQIKAWVVPSIAKVRVYSTNSDRLEWVHPRKLFSLEGLNPPDVEERLNQLIETPLTQNRKVLFGAASVKTWKVDHWPAMRAAWLLVLLQTSRTKSFLGLDRVSISDFMRRSVEDLDRLIAATMKEYTLGFVRDRGGVLMLPSTGHFALPVADDGCLTKLSIAHACPLSPEIALVWRTTTSAATPVSNDDALATRKTIRLSSFGSGPHLTRLVVPPARLQSFSNDDDLKAWIRKCRTAAQERWSAVREVRRQMIEGHRRMGFEVTRIPLTDRWQLGNARDP